MRIGVGERRWLPADTAKRVAQAVHDAFAAFTSGGLVGVSVVAHGGDQLFVETILALGGRLEVFVPAEYYRDGLSADCPATYPDVVKQPTKLQRLARVRRVER